MRLFRLDILALFPSLWPVLRVAFGLDSREQLLMPHVTCCPPAPAAAPAPAMVPHVIASCVYLWGALSALVVGLSLFWL